MLLKRGDHFTLPAAILAKLIFGLNDDHTIDRSVVRYEAWSDGTTQVTETKTTEDGWTCTRPKIIDLRVPFLTFKNAVWEVAHTTMTNGSTSDGLRHVFSGGHQVTAYAAGPLCTLPIPQIQFYQTGDFNGVDEFAAIEPLGQPQ